MCKAKQGDRVRVHYTGWLEDGTIFDSSRNRGPHDFTLGKSQVVPGFEMAVLGMTVGDTKEVNLPPRQAFGMTNRQNRARINRSNLPSGLEPQLNQQLKWTDENGQIMQARIMEIQPSYVVVDTNHPLAGKKIKFEIELLGILDTQD